MENPFGNEGAETEEIYFPFRDVFDDNTDTSPADPFVVAGSYRLDTETPIGEQYSCESGDTLFWLWTAQ